jgi:hypothetical protein
MEATSFILRRGIFMPRKQQARERRRQRRFPVTFELRVKELLQLGTQTGKRTGTIFRARAQNISTSGLGVVTNRRIEVSSPLRCEIITGELPVPIPIMAQVRWIQKDSGRKGYQAGLEFLM